MIIQSSSEPRGHRDNHERQRLDALWRTKLTDAQRNDVMNEIERIVNQLLQSNEVITAGMVFGHTQFPGGAWTYPIQHIFDAMGQSVDLSGKWAGILLYRHISERVNDNWGAFFSDEGARYWIIK